MRAAVLVAAVVVALAGGTAVAIVAMAGGSSAPSYRGSVPPVEATLPDFALRDENGRVVTSRSLAGGAVLVTFLDTQCREACPVIAGHVARALDRLGDDERAGVTALAVTTDPAEDTPAAVRGFLRRYGADGKLRYLLGSEGELRPVWRAFQVLPSADTGLDDMHSAPVRIYDRAGVWVATQHAGADLTPANLAHDLRVAAREPS
jgi:cytochrome oxidase Cu insertion factor (SCO1/SenC/PrrC family)